MKKLIWIALAIFTMSFVAGCGNGSNDAPPVNQSVALAINSVEPANNSSGNPLDVVVKAHFNKAVKPTGSFSVKDAAGVLVSGTVVPDGSDLQFRPASVLTANTTYTASVSNMTDDEGKIQAGNVSWVFTVGTQSTTTTPTDTTAPTVLMTSPANGATNVALNASISITLSEAVKASSVSATSVTMKDNTANTNVAGAVSVNGAVVSFVPTTAFVSGHNYTYTLTSSVTDLAGNAMTANNSWSFTALTSTDTTPPSISNIVPNVGATGVALDSKIVVTASENLDPATINATNVMLTYTVGVTTTTVSAPVSLAGCVITISPVASLLPLQKYDVTVTSAVKDLAGNPLISMISSSFTTGSAVSSTDTTSPTINTIVPQNGSTGAALDTKVVVTASENLDVATVNATNVVLTYTIGTTVTTVSTTVSLASNIITITPAANLLPLQKYDVTLMSGIKDLAGNPLVATVGSFFTTGTTVTTPPTGTVITMSTATAYGGTLVGNTHTVTATGADWASSDWWLNQSITSGTVYNFTVRCSSATSAYVVIQYKNHLTNAAESNTASIACNGVANTVSLTANTTNSASQFYVMSGVNPSGTVITIDDIIKN